MKQSSVKKFNPMFVFSMTELIPDLLIQLYPGFQELEYFKMYVLFTYIFVISVLLFGLAYFFSLSTMKNSEKLSQYECGFEPFDDATRHPFDVHFYVVGMLFLLFDVEIALLFPWVLTLKSTGWVSFVTMSFFLILLTIGFVYEFYSGALLWPKYHNQNTDVKLFNLKNMKSYGYSVKTK